MCRPILPNSKPKAAQIMERMEDDKLILYFGHTLIVLGAHETEIWGMCDGEHTVEFMSNIVVNKYNVSQEKASNNIIKFLNQLLERNLIK